jgi:hypothetical protein
MDVVNRLERARMALLFATGAGLLAVACVYAQAAVWPVAGLLGVGAVVCADAALNVQEKARELRSAYVRLVQQELAARGLDDGWEVQP